MDEEKLEIIGIIESAICELSSYLKIANSYTFNHCYLEEILHIALILDKMTENIEKLNNLFLENKIEKLL